MQVNSTLKSSEAERAEFDAVIKAFSESPRLARLLGFVGEKYFLGEIDQINEYNIATEVFGRSKVAFSASEDAIVRVEAHRLRQKLKAKTIPCKSAFPLERTFRYFRANRLNFHRLHQRILPEIQRTTTLFNLLLKEINQKPGTWTDQGGISFRRFHVFGCTRSSQQF